MLFIIIAPTNYSTTCISITNKQWIQHFLSSGHIFLMKKMWNLNGPHGYQFDRHDLRKKPKYFTKKNFERGSLLVWAAFSSSGCFQLQFPSPPISGTEYITVLNCNSLLSFLRENNEKNMFFKTGQYQPIYWGFIVISLHSWHEYYWKCLGNSYPKSILN